MYILTSNTIAGSDINIGTVIGGVVGGSVLVLHCVL